MSDPSYTDALQKARDDLAHAKVERLKLDNRIARLELFIRSVSSLIDEPTLDPKAGLTEGVKVLLQSVVPSGLYPTTVRAKLEAAGFTLGGQNPLAAIHAVLKRLVKQGLVQPTLQRGRMAYYWIDQDLPITDDAPPFPDAADAVKDI